MRAADTPLYDMLKLFEMGRSHMAVLMQLKKGAVERQRRHRCTAPLCLRCCCCCPFADLPAGIVFTQHHRSCCLPLVFLSSFPP
jgi:hypothetical protein